VEVGYFLSSEEFGPRELVRQAGLAEQAGFERLWLSDHFHPWNAEQGQSPFVWSVLGALSEVTRLPLATAVTCPTVRIHPAVIAQAAATVALQHEGRFTLGVGSGEALNEHILGDRWPVTDVRLDMLEEAIGVIRALLTGEQLTHHGRHYTVEDARLFTVPDQPVPIFVSGFGPKAIKLAARVGDGYMSVMPDADMVRTFRDGGGGDKPAHGGFKVCHAASVDAGVDTAYRLWPNEGLPGELAQVLPTPRHFEQATELVTRELIAGSIPCGPDPEPYVARARAFAEAGYDVVHVQQIGPDQDAFFEFWATEVTPHLNT
jgi:G6PDH family F420-dependent oxidoreductase